MVTAGRDGKVTQAGWEPDAEPDVREAGGTVGPSANNCVYT